MERCPFCAEEIPTGSAFCPQCQRSLIPVAGDVVQNKPQRTSGLAKIFWVVSLLASIAGGLVGFGGVAAANGAPQEAAAAAIGCLVVIAPYVFARGIEALTR